MGNDFYTASILPFAAIIIKVCRAYTNSQEEFEDYYQEVCLQIWRSKDSFQGQSEWSTWVYRLSLNVCLTNLRKKKKAQQCQDDTAYLSEKNCEMTPFADEAVNQLYAAIRRLPEIDRGIILLYLEEKPYREIAEIIGTNANNIGVRISRIKEKLNGFLGRKDS